MDKYRLKILGTAATAIVLSSALTFGVAAAQDKSKDLAPAPTPAPAVSAPSGDVQTGLAAYYTDRLHGRRTASGQVYNRNAMTTAHPNLPFGTKVKVTNVKTNQSVVLTVNDRGPTQPGRIVDVSRAAAQQLGMLRAGLTEVKVEVIK